MTETEQDLWRLVDVTKAIASSLDLEKVLALINDAVLSLLKADTALVVVLDENRQPALRAERRNSGGGSSGKYSHSLTEQVLNTGKPVFVLDTDLHQAAQSDSIQSLNLRTVVCAPLHSRAEIHGVLYAHSTNPINAFTEQKKQLFLALCDYAAVAIDNAQLYALSISDPMSRLYNHAYCLRRLDEELGRARRYKRSLGFMMLDLDNFKAINDKFGHRRGDEVIHAVAGVLRASTRQSDICARYGGDEFAIIMPETGDPPGDGTQPTSEVVAERIRVNLNALKIGETRVTGSIGIATYPTINGRPEENVAELVERADKALYEAKRLGRNRVCLATITSG